MGKLKAPGSDEWASHFRKLIRPWADLSEIEIKEARWVETLEKFAERGVPIWVLDESGKSLPTEKWAELFEEIRTSHKGELLFCIGGAEGLLSGPHKERIKDLLAKNRQSRTMSLGAQTLSHDLARVVWLEQMYRVLSIYKGHPYHKGSKADG